MPVTASTTAVRRRTVCSTLARVAPRCSTQSARRATEMAAAEAHEQANGAYDVELRAVTKRFGDFTAVDDVTLRVRHGEFLSLLGPSGCGKTTTLKLISGSEQ